jgi:2-methylaconitate cis-trans-isomerase PrpF
MDQHDVREQLEIIRTAAAVSMCMIKDGQEPPRVVPKIALVSPPRDQKNLSGRTNVADELDLVIRFISDAQPHRAIPLTGALCTATAAKIPGSIVNQCLSATAKSSSGKPVRIGHPSGKIEVNAVMDDKGEVESASVIRTTRRIFEGQVFWNP